MKQPVTGLVKALGAGAGLAAAIAVAPVVLPMPAHADSVRSEMPAAMPVHRLVFVDPSVRDAGAFQRLSLAGDVIHVLKPGEDAFTQMARVARRYTGLEAVVIVSHASSGRLELLGGDQDVDALRRAGADLGALGASLAPGGNLLLLGCDLAHGEKGRSFVDVLSGLVGRDVAASVDGTGHVSKGGNWTLEYATGRVPQGPVVSLALQQAWSDLLTISINTATSATNMRNAMSAPGTNGVTYTGTPSLNAATTSGAFGTFTTTGSNLGLASGAVLGTGNLAQVPGVSSFFWDGAGTGVTGAGSERDVAQLNFQFRPNAGVTKVVFQIVMGSEEYNEYVGQGFSDNIRILLSGGAYSNTNFAVVPGTSTGIDIDTINSSLNSAYYRNNEPSPGVVTDSVLDGHTTVISSVAAVTPGTTYTANMVVADYIDNLYNTAAFLGYFGASINLDLDQNNSTATGTSYVTTFTEGGAAVPVADTDGIITNYDATTIQSATIVLTNAQAGDVLSIGALPGGITGSVNTGTPGQVTVTLTGASSIANYQNAIRAVTFSNPNANMSATARNVTVLVNDGVTNSNTAVTTINISLPNANLVTVKTLASGDATPAVGSTVTYNITVTNNGPGNAGNVTLTDALPAGLTATGNNGNVTAGTYAGSTWTIPSLLNGNSATLTLEGTVNTGQNGNTITNTTTAATSNRTDPTTAGDDLTEAVTAVGIIANDDNFSGTPINGGSGGATASVFGNDVFDGSTVTAGIVTPTLTNNGGLTGAILNADGTITVPPGTTTGSYTLTYQICRVAFPADCDTANVTINVTVTPPSGTTSCTGTNLAVNGGIETPISGGVFMTPPGSVPGWSTNDTAIEIWLSGYNGVPAHTGSQFMEMNANIGTSILVQSPSAIHPRAQIDVFWAHRGRQGPDTARLTVADNAGGSTTSPNFTTGNTAWSTYSLRHVAGAAASSVTLSFDSISSTGGASLGNFLDTVEVCQTYVTLTKAEASRNDADASGNDTAGDQITYQYVIANPAGNNSSLASVEVVDDKIGTVMVTSPLSGDTNGNGFLDPGESWVVQASYTLTQTDINAGQVVNIAHANASTANNTLRSDDATVTATLPPVPTLTFNKTASIITDLNSDGEAGVGDVVRYTFTVTNGGNVTVNGISISETAFNGAGALPAPSSETLTNDAGTAGDSTDAAVDGTWDTLAPGDEIRFTTDYTVQQQDVDTLQ